MIFFLFYFPDGGGDGGLRGRFRAVATGCARRVLHRYRRWRQGDTDAQNGAYTPLSSNDSADASQASNDSSSNAPAHQASASASSHQQNPSAASSTHQQRSLNPHNTSTPVSSGGRQGLNTFVNPGYNPEYDYFEMQPARRGPQNLPPLPDYPDIDLLNMHDAPPGFENEALEKSIQTNLDQLSVKQEGDNIDGENVAPGITPATNDKHTMTTPPNDEQEVKDEENNNSAAAGDRNGEEFALFTGDGGNNADFAADEGNNADRNDQENDSDDGGNDSTAVANRNEERDDIFDDDSDQTLYDSGESIPLLSPSRSHKMTTRSMNKTPKCK